MKWNTELIDIGRSTVGKEVRRATFIMWNTCCRWSCSVPIACMRLVSSQQFTQIMKCSSTLRKVPSARRLHRQAIGMMTTNAFYWLMKSKHLRCRNTLANSAGFASIQSKRSRFPTQCCCQRFDGTDIDVDRRQNCDEETVNRDKRRKIDQRVRRCLRRRDETIWIVIHTVFRRHCLVAMSAYISNALCHETEQYHDDER